MTDITDKFKEIKDVRQVEPTEDRVQIYFNRRFNNCSFLRRYLFENGIDADEVRRTIDGYSVIHDGTEYVIMQDVKAEKPSHGRGNMQL